MVSLLEAFKAFVLRLFWVKVWISKRLQVKWVRYAGAAGATVILTWKLYSLLRCSELSDTMHVQWNVTAALPLHRRLIHDNGLGETPIMGWNGWNKYECKINEKIVRGNADVLVKLGLDLLGYNYIIVDDCWADYKRSKKGELRSHPKTFPSGMKNLASYVHGKGLKFGLYSDAGRRTCIGHRSGSEGHEFRDALTFASWGVDYLKYDNCFHKNEASHIRYPVMSEALNKSGRPIFYAICEWGEDNPAIWASRVANSWRTSIDVKDRWKRIQRLADDNNMWASYAGPGGWNDADMLQVGNGHMSLAEYRSHFTIWSIMKAPLIIGCDLRNIDESHLSIYKNSEIIAVNQDALRIQARKVNRQGACNCLEVWAGPLSGNRIVVAAWNRDWKAGQITVNWFDLGLDPEVSVRVRDLWKHEDWSGRMKNRFEITVDSHDCHVYVLTDIK